MIQTESHTGCIMAYVHSVYNIVYESSKLNLFLQGSIAIRFSYFQITASFVLWLDTRMLELYNLYIL